MSIPHAFTRDDKIAVYGNQPTAVQAMLDYDYICEREQPALVCIIDPSSPVPVSTAMFFYGSRIVQIPVYQVLDTAIEQPSLLIIFASARSAYTVCQQALQHPSIQKAVIIAEGIPERQARLLREASIKAGKYLLGPATVGGLIAGVVKIGNAGGTIDNILSNHLYHRGSVGIVSKSGGMLNEFMTLVNRVTDGVCEAVAIGGDRYPFTTLAEQAQHFQDNPDIKLILLLGEVGGVQEYAVANLITQGIITKPVVAWISGTGSTAVGQNIQFGHAGALANAEQETAQAKNAALKAAGANVPASYAELESLVAALAQQLGISPTPDSSTSRTVPTDLVTHLERGTGRHKGSIVSSISPHTAEGETYGGHPIATTAKEHGIGYILGLLWFKQEFPEATCDFFELIIKLSADHGAAVSGAHNTIVAARAGKDLVSSLASGLLTIGPRFGGAVNNAATYFLEGVRDQLPAFTFVETMKQRRIPIPGIGHRVKSKTNPDTRVQTLIEAARALEGEHRYLEYALEVETITTRKKDSLILNVDGAIAATLLDILSTRLDPKQLQSLVAMEAFNAFFVLARSIGMIGHFIDQKRLNQPLYRHPEWDILEFTEQDE